MRIARLIVPMLFVVISAQTPVFSEEAVSTPPESELSLPFYYEFNGPVDPDIWEKSYSTFEGNGCTFVPDDAEDGTDSMSLWVKILKQPEMGKKFGGGQLWSKRFFTYGTFKVKMRAPIVPGTVASFFLMNRITEGNWLHKEIDIEFLGKNRNSIQLNVHRYRVLTESAMGTPYLYRAPFDYGEDFHVYTIVWKSNSVEWHIDNETVFQTNYHVPDEPLQMLMNAWIADPSFGIGWLGRLDENTLPCRAEYQWVKYDPF